MFKKSSFIVFSVSIIAGCGGGDSKSLIPDLITMDQQAIVIGENSTGILSFATSATDIQFTVTTQKPSGVGAFVVEGGHLGIVSGETDRPASITGVLFSGAKGQNHESSKIISIVIENTSAKDLESQAQHLIDQKQDILELKEDRSIYNFLVDLAYLNNLINHSEKINLINGFNPSDQPRHSTLTNYFGEFESAFDLYQSGESSDSQLENNLAAMDQEIISHARFSNAEFSSIQAMNFESVDDLTITDFTYDPVSGRYSRLLGHVETGAYTDAHWEFTPGYALIDSFISKSISQSIPVCEVN